MGISHVLVITRVCDSHFIESIHILQPILTSFNIIIKRPPGPYEPPTLPPKPIGSPDQQAGIYRDGDNRPVYKTCAGNDGK